MLEDNRIHPTSEDWKGRMTRNAEYELGYIQNGDVLEGATDIERQPARQKSKCSSKKRCIFAGVMVLSVVIIAAIIAVAIIFSKHCLPGKICTTSTGTVSPILGTNPQTISATSDPYTISQAESTEQTQTQGNTASSATGYTTTTTTTTIITETTPFIMTTERKSCSESALYECDNGNCIDPTLVCDGHKDCGEEGNDEDNCPVTTCGADQFTCNDGTCIAEGWRCDGKEDCPNKDDELGCTTMMPTTT